MSNVREVRQKGVKFEINGEEFTLKYDLNAFAEIEDHFGDLQTGINKMSTGSIKAIRFMLWAGLIANHDDLTEKEVGAMLDLDNLGEVTKHMNEAISESMPKNVKTNPKK